MTKQKTNLESPPEMPSDLIELAEAAALVQVSVSTVFRWIKSNQIRAWSRKPIAGKRPRYFLSKSDLNQIWTPVHMTDPLPETSAEEEERLQVARRKLL